MKFEITANRLREAMNDVKINAAELSRKSNVGKAAVSHYYNGRYRPNNESAYKLSVVLGVNPIWLMGLDVPKHGPEEKKVFTVSDAFTDCANFFDEELDPIYMELVEEIAKLDKDFMIPLLGIVKRYNEERGES